MSARTFDFGNAVFHFFNVAGRKPGAALWIALWQSIFTAGLMYLAFATIGDFYFFLFEQMATGVEPTESEILSRMGGLLSYMPLISIGGILITLMAQAAWLRLLTRDEMAAVIPFRLGADEFRLFATNVGMIVVAFLLYIAVLIFTMVIGVAFAASMSGGSDMAALGVAGGMGFAVFILLMICVAVFVAVRLSAAPATTILERRIAFPSWGSTKGIFWPVLGSYVVAAIVIFILTTIVGTLINFSILGAMMPMFGSMIEAAQGGAQPDPDQIRQILHDTFSSSGTIAALIAAGLLTVIMRSFVDGIWHGIGAYVARCNQPDVPVSED
jgi:hypothetical protein